MRGLARARAFLVMLNRVLLGRVFWVLDVPVICQFVSSSSSSSSFFFVLSPTTLVNDILQLIAAAVAAVAAFAAIWAMVMVWALLGIESERSGAQRLGLVNEYASVRCISRQCNLTTLTEYAITWSGEKRKAQSGGNEGGSRPLMMLCQCAIHPSIRPSVPSTVSVG